MIEWGAQRLYQAVEVLSNAVDRQRTAKAGSLFHAVVSLARDWQESGEAQHLKRKYRKEHPEVSTELTFGS